MKRTVKVVVIGLLCLTACNRTEERAITSAGYHDTTALEDSLPVADTIYYHAFKINKDSLKFINTRFTDSQLSIILAINRIDIAKLYRLDSLIVPDTFIYNLNAYSPFPTRLIMLDSVKKLLIFAYRIQAFAAYENGTLARWGPTSMGKKSTPTPDGIFYTNWKSAETISTEDSTWILKWYFNIDNFRGISIHEYELPGYPASHACLRLREEDAKWIYNWAEQWKLSANSMTIEKYGTPLLVFGQYDFEKYAPWNDLPANPQALTVPADTLTKEITPYLPAIKEKQAIADTLIY